MAESKKGTKRIYKIIQSPDTWINSQDKLTSMQDNHSRLQAIISSNQHFILCESDGNEVIESA